MVEAPQTFAPQARTNTFPMAEQLACDARLLMQQIAENCSRMADGSTPDVALRTAVMAECAMAMMAQIERGEVA